MECLEFKDLIMMEQDVFIDEKLFMGYLQILWNQLTVSELTLIFLFFLIINVILKNSIILTSYFN